LGLYFGIYDSLKFYSKAHKYNEKLSSLISGGIAGVCCWATMYPMDYAKTLIQSDSLTAPKYKSAVDCISKEVAAKGIPVIYTGFPIMVIRAFVVNAAGFLCF
jgi:solute carrier family 25 (mitochondrial carnitine/acylcarnitine transporter), member 20/29